MSIQNSQERQRRSPDGSADSTEDAAFALVDTAWQFRDSDPETAATTVTQAKSMATTEQTHGCVKAVEGYLAWRSFDLSQADRLLREASQALEDSPHQLWYLRALNSRGALYASSGLQELGIGSFMTALEVASKLDERMLIFWINQNIGRALSEVGSFEAAEMRFLMAAQWVDEAPDGRIFLTVNHAYLHLVADRPHDARALVEQHKHLWADPTPTHGRGVGLLAQAKVALALGDLDEAMTQIGLAKECFGALGRIDSDVLETEARILLEQGLDIDAQKAISEFERLQEAGIEDLGVDLGANFAPGGRHWRCVANLPRCVASGAMRSSSTRPLPKNVSRTSAESRPC